MHGRPVKKKKKKKKPESRHECIKKSKVQRRHFFEAHTWSSVNHLGRIQRPLLALKVLYVSTSSAATRFLSNKNQLKRKTCIRIFRPTAAKSQRRMLKTRPALPHVAQHDPVSFVHAKRLRHCDPTFSTGLTGGIDRCLTQGLLGYQYRDEWDIGEGLWAWDALPWGRCWRPIDAVTWLLLRNHTVNCCMADLKPQVLRF